MSRNIRSATDLAFDPRNANKGTDRGRDLLARSIKELGLGRGTVADKHGTMIAGNKTLQAAIDAGLIRTHVVKTSGDVLVVTQRDDLDLSDPTDTRARELAYADNRVGQVDLEWDAAVVQADHEAGIALGSWFSDEELAAVMAAGVEPREGKTDPDAVPDARATDIQRGDLFELGDHILLCGDCTDAGDVARLLRSPVALAFTSPPYADLREYGGTDCRVEHLAGFIPACAPHVEMIALNLGIVRRDGAVLRYWDTYIHAAEATGYKLLSWNVWDQGANGSVGSLTAMFPIQHEFIFIFGRERRALNKTVPNKTAGRVSRPSDRQADGTLQRKHAVQVAERRALGTMVSIPSRVDVNAGVEREHPAIFPVGIATAYMEAASDRGDAVFDPFSGSGTVLIAATQLDRVGRAIEIFPKYCQIAIDRWEAFTGQRAVKVGEAIR